MSPLIIFLRAFWRIVCRAADRFYCALWQISLSRELGNFISAVRAVPPGAHFARADVPDAAASICSRYLEGA